MSDRSRDVAQFRTHEVPAFWPRTGRRAVPSVESAIKEAAGVVLRSGQRDPERLAEALGIVVRFCTLRAELGGLEAALVPDFARPFEILCDPWTATGEDHQQIKFRVAHELAHTFFYDWTAQPPRQLRSPSAAEEAYCDAFAGALVKDMAV